MRAVTAVLGPLVRLAVQGLGHELYRVHGHSMHPTLCDGDYVLVDARQQRGRPEPGDIVVASEPGNGRILIKRVLSLGEATLYLGSDDPNTGRDSRHFGSVPMDRFIGPVSRHLPVRALRSRLQRLRRE
jgi:nickel-type superoxide dismutase maturation protease